MHLYALALVYGTLSLLVAAFVVSGALSFAWWLADCLRDRTLHTRYLRDMAQSYVSLSVLASALQSFGLI